MTSPASRTRARTAFRRSTDLRVRRATLADEDLLVRHRQGMWTDIGIFTAADISAAAPAYRRWMTRERRARRFYGFLAESPEGTVVGSGAVWLQPVQPRPGALSGTEAPYIMSMYTEPAFRGRGVATQLVGSMIEWSRRRRYARITLHASAQGRPVYLRVGFEASNEMRYNLRPIARRRKGSKRLRPTRRSSSRRFGSAGEGTRLTVGEDPTSR